MVSDLRDKTQRISAHVADINLLNQNLSGRLRNVLFAANLFLIRDVLSCSEEFINSLPNIGSKTFAELKDFLSSKGIAWGGVPFAIEDSAVETNQGMPTVLRLEDKPLPAYLGNHLSVRTKNFFKNAKIESCISILKLNTNFVLQFRHAGEGTCKEIEKIKPYVLRFLTEGSFWCINYAEFTSYELFLVTFLSSFRPCSMCDLIFDHRLAIRGLGQEKTLQETAKFSGCTSERIRQIETKVKKYYFGAAGRSVLESFVVLAREAMLCFSGAVNPEQFVAKIDEITGWKNTDKKSLIHFLMCFEVVHYDKIKKVVFLPDFYEITTDINHLFVQFCSDNDRPFSDIGYDSFLLYLKEIEYKIPSSVSLEAYRVWGNDLLDANTLPRDKQQQLKAVLRSDDGRVASVGDNRSNSLKLLGVLRDAGKPLTFKEWINLSNIAFPGKNVSLGMIRSVVYNYNEVVNFDRGKFIWHEYVSIPSDLVVWAEDQMLAHMQKHSVDIISIYRLFKEKKKKVAKAGISTQTLFYFLLKRNSSGRLVYPKYPKVALPHAEGGAGAFVRIMNIRLFKGGEVAIDELHDFYSNVLCSNSMYVYLIPEITRRGNFYYLGPVRASVAQ